MEARLGSVLGHEEIYVANLEWALVLFIRVLEPRR